MINILLLIIAVLLLLIIAMSPHWVLGMFTFFKVFITPNKPPADETNRINHLRLWFFGLQHPEKFAPVYKVTGKWTHFKLMFVILLFPELFVHIFPWLTRDEQENLRID